MKSILVITVLLIILAGVIFILMYQGKVKDKNKNLIPDVVVNDIKETTEEAKRRAKNVICEVKDVVEEINDVVEEMKDVAQAIKGQKIKERKPKN